MNQPIYYTARSRFYKSANEEENEGWNLFAAKCGITRQTELLSLDNWVSWSLVMEDRYGPKTNLTHRAFNGEYLNELYNTAEFVLGITDKKENFNFLAVVVNPVQDCALVEIADYDFMGYDVMDAYCFNSALMNKGDYFPAFLPVDLNDHGLIARYEEAVAARSNFLTSNTDEKYAVINIAAIWRHRTIGRELPK